MIWLFSFAESRKEILGLFHHECPFLSKGRPLCFLNESTVAWLKLATVLKCHLYHLSLSGMYSGIVENFSSFTDAPAHATIPQRSKWQTWPSFWHGKCVGREPNTVELQRRSSPRYVLHGEYRRRPKLTVPPPLLLLPSIKSPWELYLSGDIFFFLHKNTLPYVSFSLHSSVTKPHDFLGGLR